MRGDQVNGDSDGLYPDFSVRDRRGADRGGASPGSDSGFGIDVASEIEKMIESVGWVGFVGG